mmetsp:Transcript_11215/g.8249  ORF Transcript_11215/g.8249 Transcript_11215/m.8249 type:complete len:93 (+) Transcript_11215:253-531(+)
MATDWNEKKLTDEVVERQDGRDPKIRKEFVEKKKRKKSSSSSSSSSSEEERRRKERKREKKEREKMKEKEKVVEAESDEYWLQMRKKLGIGK